MVCKQKEHTMQSLGLTKDQLRLRRNAKLAEYKLAHPTKVRNINRKNARKFRVENLDKIKEYNSDYFKAWRKNPINRKCHDARCIVGNIRSSIINGVDFRERNQQIYENLQSVYWDAYGPKNIVINHKISLKLLFTFCIDLDLLIIYDPINIETIERRKNNSVCCRRVTEDTIKVARKMEKKFKLVGLADFIQTHLGEII
jgi:hypothetical protein